MITTRLVIGGGVRRKRTPKTNKTLQEEKKMSWEANHGTETVKVAYPVLVLVRGVDVDR